MDTTSGVHIAGETKSRSALRDHDLNRSTSMNIYMMICTIRSSMKPCNVSCILQTKLILPAGHRYG